MLSAPAGRLLVVNVATPAELTLAVSSAVEPLLNTKVPKGEPAGAGAMVAVKVTD